MLEGDGDYQGASAYLEKNGKIRPDLQEDLDKLKSQKIPVDIVYDQGVQTLELQPAGSEINRQQLPPVKKEDKSQPNPKTPDKVKRPAPTPVR